LSRHLNRRAPSLSLRLLQRQGGDFDLRHSPCVRHHEKGCPILARSLRKSGIPRTHPHKGSSNRRNPHPTIELRPPCSPCVRHHEKGCPILARPLRKSGIPRTHPHKGSSNRRNPHPTIELRPPCSPCVRHHEKGCPILARSLRKSGIPRTHPHKGLSNGRNPLPTIELRPPRSPCVRHHEKGCPILARCLRKSGIPRPYPVRILAPGRPRIQLKRNRSVIPQVYVISTRRPRVPAALGGAVIFQPEHLYVHFRHPSPKAPKRAPAF
jgi:hypothetical protein